MSKVNAFWNFLEFRIWSGFWVACKIETYKPICQCIDLTKLWKITWNPNLSLVLITNSVDLAFFVDSMPSALCLQPFDFVVIFFGDVLEGGAKIII